MMRASVDFDGTNRNAPSGRGDVESNDGNFLYFGSINWRVPHVRIDAIMNLAWSSIKGEAVMRINKHLMLITFCPISHTFSLDPLFGLSTSVEAFDQASGGKDGEIVY